MNFKVDLNKSLYEQSWWKLLKPKKRLEVIKVWKNYENKIEKAIEKGEVKINPSIPPRTMVVNIPNQHLTHKEN